MLGGLGASLGNASWEEGAFGFVLCSSSFAHFGIVGVSFRCEEIIVL